MKVLLTGATGFLGAHLAAGLMQRGYTVKALKRKGSDLGEIEMVFDLKGLKKELHSHIEWVECDILDIFALTDAMQGIEQVYHAAATVSFWKKEHDAMMLTNVQGTANIVNCALDAGVKKMCYASSIAALGREKSGDIINEDTAWRDSKYNTKYAISKYLAEMEVWRGVEEGLEAVIVNPGIIIGEGRWDKGSCRLINTAYKGLKFYTKGQNGYVDVADVVRAMAELMQSPVTARRFILVAENLSFKDFFDKVAAGFGKKGPSMPAGPIMAQMARAYYAAKAMINGKEPLITGETARNSQKTFTYISNRIKTETGFQFTTFD